jgi:hypothetical protein
MSSQKGSDSDAQKFWDFKVADKNISTGSFREQK